jgi:RNA polymerase sigma factor (sigma-70 family)
LIFIPGSGKGNPGFLRFFFLSFGLQTGNNRINIYQVNSFEQERQLLEGLAKNDREVIEAIYRDNYPMVQAFILNNNGNPDEARDIFQETMIVLFEKSVSGSFELNCQLKTYIYSVCRRLWLKRLQQLQRYSNPVENGEETVSVEEELEVHEKHNADFGLMENALARIGEPCKSLLDAYYIQKKSMQDIAADFGYTNADNAKTQKYKCLVRLKKLFFAQYKNGQ